MAFKILSSLVFNFLFFSAISLAQQELLLSNDEVALFYTLIRQTKEYKTVMHQLDSANRGADENQMPQEIKMAIIKKEINSPNHIFRASLERKLAIGLSLDRYYFEYDRRKQQIVSTTHHKSKYQLE